MTSREFLKRGPVLAATLLLAAGCGGGEGGGDAPGTSSAAETVSSPVDPATAGHISATVTLSGTPPAMAPIDMGGEEGCIEGHTTPPVDGSVVAAADGGLANVFVYVKEGLEALNFPAPSQAVVLDQDGCIYHPHVLGIQVGQDLTIRNSDGFLHNINASPSTNRPFNVSQPVVMDTRRTFSAPEVMIPVRCNVHGWMTAYIGVVSHPYHAVSGPDGSVSLDGLPPGDYVVEAWHERYGGTTQNVTVATGETATLAFTFDAGRTAAAVPLGEPLDLMHPHGHRAGDHP